jgi:hypothetical protein
LQREAARPHFTSARLRCVDVDTLAVRTLVDVVASPPLGAFPGIYASALPRRCFLRSATSTANTGSGFIDDDDATDCMLLNTQLNTRVAIVAFHFKTRAVSLFNVAGLTHGSQNIVDVFASAHASLSPRILAVASASLSPPALHVADFITVANSAATRWSEVAAAASAASQKLTALLSTLAVDTIDVATDDGVGAAAFQTLVIRPRATDAAAATMPFAAFPHGGPHSAFGDAFMVGSITRSLLFNHARFCHSLLALSLLSNSHSYLRFRPY